MSGKGVAGVANRSLNRWGVSATNGRRMEGRLYLKGNDLTGLVAVALQSTDGAREYAKQTIGNVSDRWGKHMFSLTPDATDHNSRFAVYIDSPGSVNVDQVVLMDTGDRQFRGLPLRGEIGEAMVRKGLTFLRYGGSMVNVPGYRWKNMIDDSDKRPPYRGNWNPHSNNSFGIEEFLRFAETAGFTASFTVNIEEPHERTWWSV